MYEDKTGNRIKHSETPLGEGGEGAVYQTHGKWQGFVMKIYKDDIALEKKEKIEFMIKYSPLSDRLPPTIKRAFIWPVSSVYQNGQFKGYLMPMALNSKDLTWFTSTKLSLKILGDEWSKFDRDRENSFYYRLTICQNIARSVALLYATGTYALGDLKPQNVMLGLDGRIALVDIDSIQITRKGVLRFPAEVYSFEYAPPERKDIPIDEHGFRSLANYCVTESWDSFCFAILAYQVLIGVHPFSGFSPSMLTSDAIKAGMYAQGRKVQKGVFHEPFDKLPDDLRKIFNDCFSIGLNSPNSRPSFAEWYNHFKKAKSDLFPPPSIELSAPTAADIGTKVTVRWSVSHADMIELNGEQVRLSGRSKVRLDTDKTFVLKVHEMGRKFQRVVNIKAIRTPDVKLKLSNPKVTLGERVEISWELKNADLIDRITLNENPVKKDKKYRHSPKKSMSYTVKAYWKMGVIEKVIDVQVVSPPKVVFAMDKPTVIKGDKVTLSWNVEGADKVKIQNKRKPHIGQQSVTIDHSQTFELVAFWFGGQVKKVLKTSAIDGPSIEFYAKPNRVYKGGVAFLNWRVDGSAKVRFEGDAVSNQGSLKVRPQKTTQYRLEIDWQGHKITRTTEVEYKSSSNPRFNLRW